MATSHLYFFIRPCLVLPCPALCLLLMYLFIFHTHSRGLTGAQLKKLPQGSARRSLVDDITVMVITFSHPSSSHNSDI